MKSLTHFLNLDATMIHFNAEYLLNFRAGVETIGIIKRHNNAGLYSPGQLLSRSITLLHNYFF